MTQTAQILEYMQGGQSLTSLQALKLFGCMRLASRISELREYGYKFDRELVKGRSGKRYAKYSLVTRRAA